MTPGLRLCAACGGDGAEAVREKGRRVGTQWCHRCEGHGVVVTEEVAALQARVGRLKEALNDQRTGDNCWCEEGDDLEPGEKHTDYCLKAKAALDAVKKERE